MNIQKKSFLLFQLIFCTFVVALIAALAPAATYYVDPVNGNDANPGSSAQPWRTFYRAAPPIYGYSSTRSPNVAAGDTVILLDGNYGGVNFRTLGGGVNNKDWITYRAQNPLGAVFDYIQFDSLNESQNGGYDTYLAFDGIFVHCPNVFNALAASLDTCIRMSVVNHVTIRNSKITARGREQWYGQAIKIRHGRNVTIENTEINDVETGIIFEAPLPATNPAAWNENITIKNCKIYDFFDGCFDGGDLKNFVLQDSEMYGGYQKYEEIVDDAAQPASAIANWATVVKVKQIQGATTVEGTYVAVPAGWYNSVTQGNNNHLRVFLTSCTKDAYGNSIAFDTTHAFQGYDASNKPVPGAVMALPTYVQNASAHHVDMCQLYADRQGINDGLTIQRNKWHDNIDPAGQGVFVKNSRNILFENNLFYGSFGQHVCEFGMNNVNGTIRNNTYCTSSVSKNSDFEILNNASVWTNNTEYFPIQYNRAGYGNSLVRGSDGEIYQCIAYHTSSSADVPVTGANWKSYWQIISSQCVWKVYNNIFAYQPAIDAGFGKTLIFTNNALTCHAFVGIPYPDRTKNIQFYASQPLWSAIEAAKTALFADYSSNNYTINTAAASVNSIPVSSIVGFGTATTDAACPAPLTDLLGNSRSGAADIGCYVVGASLPSGTSGNTAETANNAPVNNAPVIQAIPAQNVIENTAVTFTLSAADADNDVLTFSAQNLPSGAVLSDKVFTWTPSVGQAGIYLINFVASDGIAQDIETAIITVSALQAPVFTAIGNKTGVVGTTITFDVTAANAAAYSASGLPSGATFVAGKFTWTPSVPGTANVTFTASNAAGSVSQTITITIADIAPVFDPIANKTVAIGATMSFSVNAARATSYSAAGLPAGAVFIGSTFTWTPSIVGIYTVTFIASNSAGQVSQTVTINVTGQAPVFDAIKTQYVFVNSTVSFTVNAANAASYSCLNPPYGATFANQTFTWTPTVTGSYVVNFTATNAGGTTTKSVVIMVRKRLPWQ